MERLLLIGNSRWHWGVGDHFWHCSPAQGLEQFLQQPPQRWAAVGAVPKELEAWNQSQIVVEMVPLKNQAIGLGIDRALVGWGAWQRSAGAVLVADAGTALSLTLVDSGGAFCGGRIMAGAALQLHSLNQATNALPEVLLPEVFLPEGDPLKPTEIWPQNTKAAMSVGVLQGLAAALCRSYSQMPLLFSGAKLWLTGGDAELLQPLLIEAGLQPRLALNLALEALGGLSC
jgi:type III pantothenate kinase